MLVFVFNKSKEKYLRSVNYNSLNNTAGSFYKSKKKYFISVNY